VNYVNTDHYRCKGGYHLPNPKAQKNRPHKGMALLVRESNGILNALHLVKKVASLEGVASCERDILR
jgi:hypothetical protein